MTTTLDRTRPEQAFWGTTAGRKILAETAASVLKDRKAAADAIAAIRAKAKAEGPAAYAAVEAAQAKYKAATAALAEAGRELQSAQRRRSSLSLRADQACRPHLKMLGDTADPRIFKLHDELMTVFPMSKCTLTNREAQQLAAVRTEAMTILRDRLWQEPLTDEELEERLNTIRNAVKLEG